MIATVSLEPVDPPEAVHPTAQVLDRLAAIVAPRRLVVTCYVRLGVEERIRNRYRIAVREQIRSLWAAVDQHGVPHEDREQIRRDLGRIQAFLDNAGRLPHSPGVALFACEALGLFAAIPLSLVLRTRVVLDHRPSLTETVVAVEEFKPILVAVLDRAHSRIFEVTAFEVTELADLTLPATRGGKYHSDRADSPGWGERDYHNRLREERHRRAALVAQELASLVARRPCHRIVVAGPRTTSEQVRFLPQALRDRVLGTSQLNPTAVTIREIRAVALRAREAAGRALALLFEDIASFDENRRRRGRHPGSNRIPGSDPARRCGVPVRAGRGGRRSPGAGMARTHRPRNLGSGSGEVRLRVSCSS